ncbi:MAG: 30S ribosomal protein S16 [Patescibacteria group bacterium]
MLRIRLRRTGKKHQPHYRIVVAEHTAPVSGKYVEVLGHYNPRSKELVLQDEAVMGWLNKGAQPSNTIARLLLKKGMKHKLITVHTYPERPGKNVPAEEPAKAAEAPTETDAATEEPTNTATESAATAEEATDATAEPAADEPVVAEAEAPTPDTDEAKKE